MGLLVPRPRSRSIRGVERTLKRKLTEARPMRNKFNLSIAILIFAVLGCSCPSKLGELVNTGKPPPPPPRSTPVSPAATPASRIPDAPIPPTGKGGYDLTLDKYNRLSIGQSRSEVESILGGKGTELSNTVGGGVRFTVNKWEGDNYTSII